MMKIYQDLDRRESRACSTAALCLVLTVFPTASPFSFNNKKHGMVSIL